MAIVLGVYLMPALIRNRKEAVETPVEDRFSCDMKLVCYDRPGLAVRGEIGRHQPRILTNTTIQMLESHPVIHVDARTEVVEEGGRSMSSNRGQVSSAGSGVPSTSRELARLRASRAARIASEDAAGKRRVTITGVSLTLLVAFVVAAAFSPFSWGWALIPVAAIAATLGSGRLAYKRSVEASDREVEQLHRLREARGREQDRYRRVSTSSKPVVRDVEIVDEVVEDAAEETVAESVEAPVEWTPRPLPKPLYAQKQAAPRRRVVMDQSVVEATTSGEESEVSTPVRPTAAKQMPNDAMTSQEAAEQAPVAFDIEEILEHRRAQ